MPRSPIRRLRAEAFLQTLRPTPSCPLPVQGCARRSRAPPRPASTHPRRGRRGDVRHAHGSHLCGETRCDSNDRVGRGGMGVVGRAGWDGSRMGCRRARWGAACWDVDFEEGPCRHQIEGQADTYTLGTLCPPCFSAGAASTPSGIPHGRGVD